MKLKPIYGHYSTSIEAIIYMIAKVSTLLPHVIVHNAYYTLIN